MRQLTARVLATLPVATFSIGTAIAADPVANAGSDVLVVDGRSVRLDGAASYHPDRKMLSYAWSVIDGTASIDDRTTVRPTVDLTSGAATLQLTVSDGGGASATDTVVVSTANLPPLAVASLDRRADVGKALRLDVTGSTDPNGDRLTYAWRLVSAPEGSSAALGDASAVRPAFTPDAEGQYAFELVVTDQDGAASEPTVLLVDTANAAPVADAGIDRAVATGDVVRLSAERSYDLDGDFLGRHWKLLARPPGSRARLAIGEDGRRAFTADRDGDYVLQLRVRDKQKVDAFDTVVVSAGGTVVRADAGQPQRVAADETAVLTAASTVGGHDRWRRPLLPLVAPVGAGRVRNGHQGR